jgi:hypothetical protein
MGRVLIFTPRPHLTPNKGPPVPTVYKAGWGLELVWKQKLEEKSVASAENRTPVVQPVVKHSVGWPFPNLRTNMKPKNDRVPFLMGCTLPLIYILACETNPVKITSTQLTEYDVLNFDLRFVKCYSFRGNFSSVWWYSHLETILHWLPISYLRRSLNYTNYTESDCVRRCSWLAKIKDQKGFGCGLLNSSTPVFPGEADENNKTLGQNRKKPDYSSNLMSLECKLISLPRYQFARRFTHYNSLYLWFI